MYAKIFIVALCAFQVAYGDTLNDTIANASSTIAGAQAQLSAATEQLQTSFDAAQQSISSQVETQMATVQQYADSMTATVQQAQPQIQACIDTMTQQMTQVSDAATATLQAQQANLSQTIQNANQTVNSQSSALQSTSTQATSSYQTCYDDYIATHPLQYITLPFVGKVPNAPINTAIIGAAVTSCGTTAVMTQYINTVNAISDGVQAAMTPVLQIFSPSTLTTAADAVTAMIPDFSQTVDLGTNFINSISQQAQQCINQAAAESTTAAG